MPTGACGIDCDVCRLHLLGSCTTCGPGTGREAAAKQEAQERLLGQACPILSCAVLNHKSFCLRDCSQFPCRNFQSDPYPFSRVPVYYLFGDLEGHADPRLSIFFDRSVQNLFPPPLSGVWSIWSMVICFRFKRTDVPFPGRVQK